jgi:LysM repeat protein
VANSCTVEQFAKHHEVSVDALLERNPNYNRGHRLPSGATIVMPTRLPQAWENPNAPTSRTVVHHVEDGESIDSIAHRYGVTAESIRRNNGGIVGSHPPAGRRIVIHEHDTDARPSQQYNYTVAQTGPMPIHRIAQQHGVSVEELRRHNGWAAGVNEMQPGAHVVVPPPQRQASWQSATRTLTHTASRDDNLASVAYRYGVSEDEVLLYNPELRNRTLAPGQHIIIGEPGGYRQQQQTQHQPSHTFRQNESVAQVAAAYGVSEQSLRSANAGARFQPHETIVIPPSRYNQAYTSYETAPGESAREIALRYGITETVLVQANPGAIFGTGRREQIVIPPCAPDIYTAEQTRVERVMVAPSSPRDTPESFAQRYGIPPQQLERANVAVDLRSSMPSRIILPDAGTDSYRQPPPLPRHTAAHTLTYDAYQRKEHESVDDVAQRFQLPVEVVKALNPNFGSRSGGQTVLLPEGATAAASPASPTGAQHAAFSQRAETEASLRRAGAVEDALANRDVLLDRYERAMMDLQHGRVGDARQAATQMEYLMNEYERVANELHRCAAANRNWEAQCTTLQQALSMSADADLRRELARVGAELHHARSHFAEHEQHVRIDMEREFTRRARVLERAHREEAERMKAELEHRLLASSQAARQRESGGVSPVPSGSNAAGAGAAAGAYQGPTISDLEPFLRFKEDSYAQLVREHKHLEEQYSLVQARCSTLDEKFETMAFAIDSRPSLLKIIFDLHKLADASSSALEDLALRLSVRELNRRLVQQELAGISADVRDLARSHHWIIGNLFTEVEVLHLGSSPASFHDTVDPRLALEAPKRNPSVPQRGSTPTRGRSSTPVRVLRTTTTTTTTTMKAPRPSTARGF